MSENSLKINIIFFAKAKDLAGIQKSQLNISDTSDLTGSKLLQILIQNYPK